MKVKADTEKPHNQINILERKVNLLSNLLLEWKSYETILNMTHRELKEVAQVGRDADKVNKESMERHRHESLKTKGDSMPHEVGIPGNNSSLANNKDLNYDSGYETEADETEKTDLTSIFGTEEAEKFELEFEQLRNRSSSLFGDQTADVKVKPSNVDISYKFIDKIMPDVMMNPIRFETLDSLEDALISSNLDDGTGENKLITEILQDQLDRLENENITTRQKNKLNQIRRIISRISEIRIYNPKLLEKMVQNMN